MSELDKAKARIQSKPKNYTYTEARELLTELGFIEHNKGRVSEFRTCFFREEDGKTILLHKPQSGDIMDRGAVKYVLDYLTELGEL